MRATFLILVLLMQSSVAAVSVAQEEKAAERPPIPEQYKEFVAEIESIYEKYPEAATRFRLVDLGRNPRMECTVECEFDLQWGGWCKDRCELEE